MGWRLVQRAALVWAVLFATGCTHLYFLALNGRADAQEVSTVQPIEGLPLGMDIYRPASTDTPAPVLVFFYGGRWQDGNREDYAFVGRRLAARGLLVMVPDYRLYPEVRFPAFVEDAAAIAAWAKANAARFGGDPNQIHLAGHSAGAHMVALVGTDARYLAAHDLKPSDLAGVIGLAGPYDFLPLTDDDLIDIFGDEPQAQQASQPVNFADGDEPPFLLLHGGSDLLVWPLNSEHLKAKLEAAGSPVRYIEYPGVGHIRILASLRYPGLAPTQQDILQFIRQRDSLAVEQTAGPQQARVLSARHSAPRDAPRRD
ncbi:alpha/beta hydrolase [Pseudomarimonas arenosa]|uniref:Alpha/beta hydrolase n=1 Tax=Pseudomarimonas arenosa TaxID=2774145 RepID=A0AAW3ZM01_9GAMM|nr:alpha/beta hydrolase [Pseudomarimonas arenosa]MBD8527160.1 alpha/beta hydrolase [Pseudomarimonas arenosa]